MMSVLSPLFHLIKAAPLPVAESVPILFLLHGHGGNEHSMDVLVEGIPVNWKVISLRAPIEISPGRFKWYTVDRSVNPIQINLEEEARSRQAILDTVLAFCKDPSVDQQRVVLAGFSQGAIMALSCALTAPQWVNACAVFSGRFLHEIRPQIHPAAKSLRVLLAHGRTDQILPVEYLRENLAALKALGISADCAEDDAGHILSAMHKSHFIHWLSDL